MTKKIHLLLFAISFLLLLLPSSGLALDMQKHPEVNQEVRNSVALTQLQKEPNSIALYVKGLCCPSCSIGVRRKISRLEGVDLARFNKGVDLDAKHQIATIAVKEGKLPKLSELAEAVDDAGYVAVHLYTLENDKLQTTEISAD